MTYVYTALFTGLLLFDNLEPVLMHLIISAQATQEAFIIKEITAVTFIMSIFLATFSHLDLVWAVLGQSSFGLKSFHQFSAQTTAGGSGMPEAVAA